MNVQRALSLGLAAGIGYLLAGLRPSPPAAPELPPPVLIREAPLDEGAVARAVERALSQALDEPTVSEPSEPATAAPAPRAPLLVDAEGDGLALVDEIVARGEATPEDVLALKQSLASTDREGARRVLSRWFRSIREGQVQISLPPL